MKLEDFETVRKLIADRDYYVALQQRSNGITRITIGNHDVRPYLVEKMLPEMSMLIGMEIARVDEELAKLGVRNEQKPFANVTAEKPFSYVGAGQGPGGQGSSWNDAAQASGVA